MKSLMVSSTSKFAGKSLFCIALGKRFQRDGYRLKYMKPVGEHPKTVGGKLADRDAVFIQESLGLDEPLELLCPVVVTDDLQMKAYKGTLPDLGKRIRAALRKLSRDADIMLTSGFGSVCQGLWLDLCDVHLAEVFGSQVLLIDRFEREVGIDQILATASCLGKRLIGVVLNAVPAPKIDMVTKRIVPFLKRRGVHVVGILPYDVVLAAATVKALADRLGAEVICSREKLGRLVESFVIGAMSVESALKYFQRVPHKAVITGGDRSDIQLAALETSTRCLILTGGLYPNDVIIGRAADLGVPILVVKSDTLSTVERLESRLGRLCVHEDVKVERGTEFILKRLDMPRIYKSLGLRMR